MGGPSNLSLSSHRQDDEKYNAKKRELRQYLPQLAHHLDLLSTKLPNGFLFHDYYVQRGQLFFADSLAVLPEKSAKNSLPLCICIFLKILNFLDHFETML